MHKINRTHTLGYMYSICTKGFHLSFSLYSDQILMQGISMKYSLDHVFSTDHDCLTWGGGDSQSSGSLCVNSFPC